MAKVKLVITITSLKMFLISIFCVLVLLFSISKVFSVSCYNVGSCLQDYICDANGMCKAVGDYSQQRCLTLCGYGHHSNELGGSCGISFPKTIFSLNCQYPGLTGCGGLRCTPDDENCP